MIIVVLLNLIIAKMSDTFAVINAEGEQIAGKLNYVFTWSTLGNTSPDALGGHTYAIIEVATKRELVISRAAKRAESTGRTVPARLLEAAIDEVGADLLHHVSSFVLLYAGTDHSEWQPSRSVTRNTQR